MHGAILKSEREMSVVFVRAYADEVEQLQRECFERGQTLSNHVRKSLGLSNPIPKNAKQPDRVYAIPGRKKR